MASVTRFGDFWKFLLTHFLTILVAQIFGDFLGILKNVTLKTKTSVAKFWAILGKLGYFLFQHLVTLFTTYENDPIDEESQEDFAGADNADDSRGTFLKK